MSLKGDFQYRRRSTTEVSVGGVAMGGSNPIRVQSMTSVPTMDTAACVEQCRKIVEAGGEYVRLTAQGVREADNIGVIGSELRAQGIDVPLIADIHFNPRAAFAAAKTAQKVRINPGNFVDPGRTFRKIEFTDEEYVAEIERIDAALTPFLELCKASGTAVRIGVNHGSLSDRIMSRYGDTPTGMVESAMEFLRICRKCDFSNVVISIKASNVVIMVQTVRLLVATMAKEDMHYPLHLGVTEAGDGEDGRIKSAVGIGTLLAEGIGDTIRVSLSEDPEREIPVAKAIVKYIGSRANAPVVAGEFAPGYNPINPSRRKSIEIKGVGGENLPVVMAADSAIEYPVDVCPDLYLDSADVKFVELDASEPVDVRDNLPKDAIILLGSSHPDYIGSMSATLHEMMRRGITNPVIIKASYKGISADEATLRASIDLGTLLMNGFSDGVLFEADSLTPAEAARIAYAILQSTRQRVSHTEFISCPGCGRTLFNLQSTLARVKASTSHLKGLKIGVMGCIVNGPGEMADADYGYVGAGVGKVSLYKGKECIEKNIPEEEAVERLIRLIESEGDWK